MRVMLVKKKKKAMYLENGKLQWLCKQKNEVRESIIFVQASYIYLYTDFADWLICTSDFH